MNRGLLNRYFCKIYRVCALIIGLLPIFSGQVLARQNNPISVTITTYDHYTESLLDSVHLRLYREGVLLDSTITGANGQAVLFITVTSIPQTGDKPATFSLGHNYPNPFLDETRVDVALPHPQQLRIEVFNILGQRVARSVVPLQEGFYTLNMTLGNLPTGVYLLRMTGTESRVVKMTKVGRGGFIAGDRLNIQPGISPSQREMNNGISESGYMLRADRNRYRPEELPANFTESIALTMPMIRNNLVVFTTAGSDELPLNEEIELVGDEYLRSVITPDTLVLKSGIYSIKSRNKPIFNVEQLVEIVSRDTVFRLIHEVPIEVVLSGRVVDETGEQVSGAMVRIFKDGALITNLITDGVGSYETELIADLSHYSILASSPPAVGEEFDPLGHTGYSTDMKTLVPRPTGEYRMNFVLRREQNLVFSDGLEDSLVSPYTLSTPTGTVSVWGLLPEMQIVGGSAQAYSPTYSPDAFPGEFETRQNGLESGLTSGGFVSVNLLRNNQGTIEPVSKLEDEQGGPVRVTLRFRMDPADWSVIRSDEFYSYLPGYVNRPDRINVPLYHYDEEAGDWILTGEFGWLESVYGPIPPTELEAIRTGEFQKDIFVVGTTEHFSFINLDYPMIKACMTGRMVTPNGNPIPNAEITFYSIAIAGSGVTFFSNRFSAVTDLAGYFRVVVPRSEINSADDWNRNNRVDEYRIGGIYEDPVAGTISIFHNNEMGYPTPKKEESSGCEHMQNLVAQPKLPVRKSIELSFKENVLAGSPDYPLYVNQPFHVYNKAEVTLTDPFIPQGSPIWSSVCGLTGTGTDCDVKKNVTSQDGKINLTVPILPDDVNDPPTILTGKFEYTKARPDLGFGMFEISDCSFTIQKNVNAGTVLCDVERRGPPVITILQPLSTNPDPQNPEYNYLFDDIITLEATGTDNNGNSIDHLNGFNWINIRDWRLVGRERIMETTAGTAFGSGTDRLLRVSARDLHGNTGHAELGGVNVSTVTVSVTPAVAMIATGNSLQLGSEVSGASETGVTWISSNETIATVTPDGLVFALSAGNVIITARSMADPGRFSVSEIEVEHLIAAFTVSPPAGSPDTEFSFDASDSEGDIAAYSWDLGDETEKSGVSVDHTYGASGEFVVRLEVTSTRGSAVFAEKVVNTTGKPIAVIHADPVSGNPPLLVNFDGSESYSPAGTITEWNWDYGDGNTGSGNTTSHTFSATGIFIARLTVTDEQDNTATDSVLITVNTPPIASFTVNPPTGSIPLTVNVDATGSSDPDGQIVRYSWNFGDGQFIPNGNVTEQHTYTESGYYTIQLTVEDNLGATATTSVPVISECNTAIAGNFNIQTMQDFDQLFGICRIIGDLFISGHQITDVLPLYALQQVNGSVTVRNTSVTNLLGLDDLFLIGGFLNIGENEGLISLEALSGLRSVQQVNISINPELTTLSGLNNLTSEMYSVSLVANAKLSDLNAFNHIEQIHTLQITDSPALTSFHAFSGLSRIENSLVITNTGISQCEVLEFRERILDAGGIGTIIDGFLQSYVQLTGNADIATGDFTITSPADILPLQGICAIQGNLTISNSSLTNLSGLETLMAVSERTSIMSNSQLITLSGLDNLVEASGSMQINFNPILVTLEGLGRMRAANQLVVSNNAQLRNMTGLQSLEKLGGLTFQFTGGLSIYENALMESLEGLENLKVIRGNLVMFFLDNLITISALQNLETSPGTDLSALFELRLTNLPLLSSLNGLGKLKSTRSIEIRDLPILESLDGLMNMEEINGPMTLSGLGSLTDLFGMSGLNSIIGNVSISEIPGLTNLAGIESILQAAQWLEISNMPDLINLHGLETMQEYTTLYLYRNPALETLQGLESLQIIEHLNISENDALITLDALQNLDEVSYLTVISNPVLASISGLENLTKAESISMFNLPGITDLSGLSGIQHIGTLELNLLPSLTSLSGLGSFDTVGSLTLIDLPLIDLNGLENLVTISQALRIYNNQNLQSLSGLENLNQVQEYLSIDSNPVLVDISGLSGISDMSGRLQIGRNHSLENLDGLSGLQSAGQLIIEENNALQNLQGLSNIIGAMDGLQVTGNPVLSSLAGLEGVTEISGFTGLRITQNDALVNLSGLLNLERIAAGAMVIQYNPALASITGMAALSRVGEGFNILYNNILPTCDAEELRDQVLSREGISGLAFIEGNNDDGQCPSGFSVVD